MKVLLLIICIVSLAHFVSANGEKRALSPEERQKILDAFNKDRQEIGKKAGITMKQLTYNVTGEAQFPIFTLHWLVVDSTLYLKGNDVYNRYHEGKNKNNSNWKSQESIYFFNPNAETIACSKIFKARQKLDITDAYVYKEDRSLDGKTAEAYGVCRFEKAEKDYPEFKSKLTGIQLPPKSKYADILGVTETISEEVMLAETSGEQGSGATGAAGAAEATGEQKSAAGNGFNNLIFLFLVFYI
ncbi:unnamed protein product [Caenorhabditis brenneri]